MLSFKDGLSLSPWFGCFFHSVTLALLDEANPSIVKLVLFLYFTIRAMKKSISFQGVDQKDSHREKDEERAARTLQRHWRQYSKQVSSARLLAESLWF